MNPLQTFIKWFEEERSQSEDSIPTAVCLSTQGLDGFPNARFVSFKELVDDCFVITGPLHSRKGKEIESNNKVALTFWWKATERQVRIQGTASKVSSKQADKYFKERDLDSQVVSVLCEQGKPVENIKALHEKFNERIAIGRAVDRPDDWGGFLIKPLRIELMEFRQNRFHERMLFSWENDHWHMQHIQP